MSSRAVTAARSVGATHGTRIRVVPALPAIGPSAWHVPRHTGGTISGPDVPRREAVDAVACRGDLASCHASRASPAPQFTSLDEAIVEEIMVPSPITFTPETTCKAAARKLLDADIASAPVVDSWGRLVGMLTESDLLWKGAGTPLEHTIIPPTFIGAFDLLISLRDSAQVQAEIDKILARTVKEAMSKTVVSVKPSAPLSTAAHLMLAHKVHALPVVDDSGKVIGLVTQHDILRGMVAEQLPLL